MKWTCKKCMKKYKHKDSEEVECTDSQCDVKYDMTSIELDFAGNPGFNKKTIEMEAVFESPEPVVSSGTELTVDQWQELLAAGYICSPHDQPPC